MSLSSCVAIHPSEEIYQTYSASNTDQLLNFFIQGVWTVPLDQLMENSTEFGTTGRYAQVTMPNYLPHTGMPFNTQQCTSTKPNVSAGIQRENFAPGIDQYQVTIGMLYNYFNESTRQCGFQSVSIGTPGSPLQYLTSDFNSVYFPTLFADDMSTLLTEKGLPMPYCVWQFFDGIRHWECIMGNQVSIYYHLPWPISVMEIETRQVYQDGEYRAANQLSAFRISNLNVSSQDRNKSLAEIYSQNLNNPQINAEFANLNKALLDVKNFEYLQRTNQEAAIIAERQAREAALDTEITQIETGLPPLEIQNNDDFFDTLENINIIPEERQQSSIPISTRIDGESCTIVSGGSGGGAMALNYTPNQWVCGLAFGSGA